jgi:hypothetical protein
MGLTGDVLPTPPAKDSEQTAMPARPAAFQYWAKSHGFFQKRGVRGEW